MNDYRCHLQHAPLCPLPNNNALTLYDPNVAYGFFSDELHPAFEQFLHDPYMIQSDETSLFSMVVNEGFDQYDPLYASLDFPKQDSPSSLLPIPPKDGRPRLGNCESFRNERFGSPLLWSNELATNKLDTGVAFLKKEMYQPMPVSRDMETKECGRAEADKDELKNEQSERPKRTRKRSDKQMNGNSSSVKSNNWVADALTWEILSQYFYMPIAQAAEELNIGLTLFKKRCRELGVRRWPHRKLMSIETVIKNVKELVKDGGFDPSLSKGKVLNAIELLEIQKKRMEIMPDAELETQTKRLRQACFKANYKRRRLAIMNGGVLENNSNGSLSYNNEPECSVNDNVTNGLDLDDSYELKSLLIDPCTVDCSFLDDYTYKQIGD